VLPCALFSLGQGFNCPQAQVLGLVPLGVRALGGDGSLGGDGCVSPDLGVNPEFGVVGLEANGLGLPDQPLLGLMLTHDCWGAPGLATEGTPH